ncbi:MAG: hypothetical protein ACRDHP_10120, partial [Ktedonobacterales bacterium]
VFPLHGATAPTPLSPARSTQMPRVAGSLGAASASPRWQWATGATGTGGASSVPPARETAVRVPPLLLKEMSAAASARGRSLSEVWTEAARDWLLRQHPHEDEPQPPTPAAAALAIPKPARSWAAIDAALADLRRVPHDAPAAVTPRHAHFQEPTSSLSSLLSRSA